MISGPLVTASFEKQTPGSVPPVTASTSDVITFDQNRHLCSTSLEGKDLSNGTQIRGIGSMEPEICRKILRNLSENLRAKFPATTQGCSMANIAHFNDAFSDVFEQEARILISAHAQPKMSKNATLVERKACCHVANAFFGNWNKFGPYVA